MSEPTHAGRLVFWRPPERHFPARVWFGMPTRRGGVSVGPFASLNLGLEVGDEREAVLRNRALVFGALAIDARGPARLHQVHGTRIATPSEAPCQGDGFLLETGDSWAAVSAADCAPVAIVARSGALGAIVHSGWRGARDGIAARAARLLIERGIPAPELRAAIGPCIHACCYPVGPEVACDFPREALRPHASGVALDLPFAIARGLIEAGLSAEAVHAAPECTSCRAEDFYSHRRDRGVTGRHWALLHLDHAGARSATGGGSSARP